MGKQMTSTQNQSSSREWNSDAYHRLSAPQVSWGKKVLSRLRLRGDEAVLDAGCGTGRLTAELLEALPRGRVVGIDLSQNMLRSAREHLAQFQLRANLVVCDLLRLPFAASFDGIVSTAAFHWVLRPRSTVYQPAARSGSRRLAGSPVRRRTEPVLPAPTCRRTGCDQEICLVLRGLP